MIALKTPTEALIQIAIMMRQRRLDYNITQKQLAQRADVSIATLRKFEHTGKISLESFLKLTFVLNLMEDILNALKVKSETFKSMDELLEAEHKPTRKRART
jgi:transcriptional regulator with XRE-family HTH domain